MSIGVTINVGDDSPIVQALSKMLLDGSNKKRLFDKIGGSLADDNRLRFDTEASPDGEPWAKSWRATHQGGQTLRDTGRLMNSIAYAIGGDVIRVGTNVDYGPALHYGATIKPVAGKFLKFGSEEKPVFMKQVVLPARPFLGINTEDETNVLDIINQFFQV